jgi:CPA1 family monovalent cation:H+ antiporter
MQGVVSLPADFPQRDFVLVTTFAVIVMKVLVQGSTLAPLIRFMNVRERGVRPASQLTEMQARLRLAKIELAKIERHSLQENGTHHHPRMVEQYAFRINAISCSVEAGGALDPVRIFHFSTMLAAVKAARAELLVMHRSGEIGDDMMQRLEFELDGNEMRLRQFHAPTQHIQPSAAPAPRRPDGDKPAGPPRIASCCRKDDAMP